MSKLLTHAQLEVLWRSYRPTDRSFHVVVVDRGDLSIEEGEVSVHQMSALQKDTFSVRINGKRFEIVTDVIKRATVEGQEFVTIIGHTYWPERVYQVIITL